MLGSEPVQEVVESVDERNASNPELDHVDVQKLRRFFELPEYMDEDQKIKLEEIHNYFKSHNITPENYDTELRKLELKLGGPVRGETRHGKIWGYLRLEARLENTLKEMESYGKHNT